MHLLYLGVTSAGTDDLGMSSSVSVLLLNKVFDKDTPACLHKDFSLQSCLDLVFLILILLPWDLHIISLLTVCSYWTKHKCTHSTFFLGGQDRASTQCVFLAGQILVWYHNDEYCMSILSRQKTLNNHLADQQKEKNLFDLLLGSIRKVEWSNCGTALTLWGQYSLCQGGWNTLYTTNSWQDFTLLRVFISFCIRPLRVWKQ